jgi:predicted TIM-barrel fold metal-dependent hydrolase
VSPHLAIIADHILGNNLVLKAAKSYPERVIALATANIHYDLPNLKELKRCFQHSEFKGIKLHPDFMAYSVKKHILDPIFKFADDHGAFILTHTDSRTNSGHLLKYSEPAWFEEYLTKFPKVNLILAHCGLTSGGFKGSVQLAKNFKNAYLDTSGWRFSNTWSIEETANFGIVHKLLFGGDFVWNDVASTLGRILYSDISEEDKKKILGENILEILRK